MEQQPGKNLVDSYPILANLPKPLQWWRPRGQAIHEQTCRAYAHFQDEMLRKIEKGTAKHCFGRMVNENKKELGFDDKQAMFVGIRPPQMRSDDQAQASSKQGQIQPEARSMSFLLPLSINQIGSIAHARSWSAFVEMPSGCRHLQTCQNYRTSKPLPKKPFAGVPWSM